MPQQLAWWLIREYENIRKKKYHYSKSANGNTHTHTQNSSSRMAELLGLWARLSQHKYWMRHRSFVIHNLRALFWLDISMFDALFRTHFSLSSPLITFQSICLLSNFSYLLVSHTPHCKTASHSAQNMSIFALSRAHVASDSNSLLFTVFLIRTIHNLYYFAWRLNWAPTILQSPWKCIVSNAT